jgi:hypothetical protein
LKILGFSEHEIEALKSHKTEDKRETKPYPHKYEPTIDKTRYELKKNVTTSKTSKQKRKLDERDSKKPLINDLLPKYSPIESSEQKESSKN